MINFNFGFGTIKEFSTEFTTSTQTQRTTTSTISTSVSTTFTTNYTTTFSTCCGSRNTSYTGWGPHPGEWYDYIEYNPSATAVFMTGPGNFTAPRGTRQRGCYCAGPQFGSFDTVYSGLRLEFFSCCFGPHTRNTSVFRNTSRNTSRTTSCNFSTSFTTSFNTSFTTSAITTRNTTFYKS